MKDINMDVHESAIRHGTKKKHKESIIKTDGLLALHGDAKSNCSFETE